MRRALGGAVVVGLLVVAVAVGAPAPTGVLRYQFRKGGRIDYVLEQKAVMEVSAPGRNASAELTQTLDVVWRTLDVDARGVATITQTVERLRFVVDGPPPVGKGEYDSAN